MKVAKAVAWLGLFAMTAVLLNGFIAGDFSKDGAELLANPWGIVSIVDLYVGFALFSIWIAIRETNTAVAVTWIILMMVFGFFAGSIYILAALYGSKGDWLTALLGGRKAALLEDRR